MKKYVITIDGPAASGKSTLSKNLSKRLGIRYIDTGAMYRAFALYAIRRGRNLDDENDLKDLFEGFNIQFREVEGETRIYLSDEDITEKIREKEIGEGASRVSVHRSVRMKMVELQRKLGENGGIFDGRDMGTFVFPDADLKIYLTATEEERARRKLREWKERGIDGTYEEALEDIRRRDMRDSMRAFAPLKKADDAIEIDTTSLSPEEVIEVVLKILKKRHIVNG